jgi:ABC-2 type transport system permease protein
MKTIRTFIRKEFLHVFRDPKTLLLLFGLPIAQILIFGFALTNEIKNSKIVVCNQSNDALSQKLLNQFNHSRNFQLLATFSNYSLVETYFKQGNVKLAIIIPPHFEQTLRHQGKNTIQIIADASDPNTATTLSGYANAIINQYNTTLNQGQLGMIQTNRRMLYNPQLEGTTNFVPGVMALVLLLVCVLMTSVSIVKEKEYGTMELLLISPVTPLVVVITKAIPYLALSIINLAAILLISVFLLHMPIHGSIFLLFGVSILFIITSLSLGLLISSVAQSQQIAMVISLMVMMLPAMLFTGFMFPIENMPLPLRVISHIVPSRWYYIIVKSIMIKGLGITAIWKEVSILVTMTTLLLFASIKRFKNRLA